MLGYYFDLAWRSLRRSPGLTALMVLSIGVGVMLAMSSWTLVHLMARNPLPRKSAEIYFPTVAMWNPAVLQKQTGGSDPPPLLDYGTAEALLSDHRARYQSAVYWINTTIVPNMAGEHPFYVSGFAVTGQFFPLVDAPFEYGSGWNNADDANRAQVVVIGQELNNRVFGGGNSVGKMLGIKGHDYRIVGVLKHWDPEPAYYDVPAFGGYMTQVPGVFLPFNTAIAAKMWNSGNTQCSTSSGPATFAGLLRSSCAWISYVAQLDTPKAALDYKDYLEGVARQRFTWPPNVQLHGLMAWLDYLQVVPVQIRMLRWVGVGLLIVCLVDTIGLMLAKFLRRSGEIGVRRALGAPRRAIYAQFLTEGALIGVAGGIAGLVLTWLDMLWLRAKFPHNWGALTQLNVGVLALTLAVAIVATLLAAAYPVWRAAHVQPAWQLKTN